MGASDRFKPVVKVAANREADAARKFGQSRQQQQAEEQKLANLREYHLEYMQRFRNAAASGISVAQMREYQAFISKLETAIEQQLNVVEDSKKRVVEQKKVWTTQHVRTQSMDKAMQRLVDQEKREENAREQKASDEIAQRLRRGR